MPPNVSHPVKHRPPSTPPQNDKNKEVVSRSARSACPSNVPFTYISPSSSFHIPILSINSILSYFPPICHFPRFLSLQFLLFSHPNKRKIKRKRKMESLKLNLFVIVLVALLAIEKAAAADAPAPSPTSDATAFVPTLFASFTAFLLGYFFC
ncbi:hypothetical protein MRB53_012209 [Persea americana]|uniref:Uncharacterized protein n=1 Tax=Persea americana TaxID=3435 RepID=A0ACC2LX03_PERAE|nr:hypothetical protein MRB53_012209 [Persea americana]